MLYFHHNFFSVEVGCWGHTALHQSKIGSLHRCHVLYTEKAKVKPWQKRWFFQNVGGPMTTSIKIFRNFGKNSQRCFLPNLANSKWWDTGAMTTTWIWMNNHQQKKGMQETFPTLWLISWVFFTQPGESFLKVVAQYLDEFESHILFIDRKVLANYQLANWKDGNYLRCISDDDSIDMWHGKSCDFELTLRFVAVFEASMKNKQKHGNNW